MSDQQFREIQLTGKQLVFLFMASLVLAVAIFLLGVSVGRGVGGGALAIAPAEGASASATDRTVPAEMPPATVTSPADLSYHSQLQGQSALAAQTPGNLTESPSPTAETPPSPSASVSPASQARGTAPALAPLSAASPPRSVPTPPANPGWFVQAGAFGTRGNADKLIGQLKSKGHTASVVTSRIAPAFRVRFGPFKERAEADRLAVQLRAEGFTSSVTR